MAMGAGGMGDDGMGGMVMPPPPNADHGGGGMGKKMMTMHMSFFWGRRVDVLFSGWPGDRGIAMYLLALLFVFAVAAAAECLSYLPLGRTSRRPTSAAGSLLLTALAAVRTGLSYLVMLAVMSFNVGVLLAAVAGHALGFFVFGSGIIKQRSVAADEIRPPAYQMVLPTKC